MIFSILPKRVLFLLLIILIEFQFSSCHRGIYFTSDRRKRQYFTRNMEDITGASSFIGKHFLNDRKIILVREIAESDYNVAEEKLTKGAKIGQIRIVHGKILEFVVLDKWTQGRCSDFVHTGNNYANKITSISWLNPETNANATIKFINYNDWKRFSIKKIIKGSPTGKFYITIDDIPYFFFHRRGIRAKLLIDKIENKYKKKHKTKLQALD